MIYRAKPSAIIFLTCLRERFDTAEDKELFALLVIASL